MLMHQITIQLLQMIQAAVYIQYMDVLMQEQVTMIQMQIQMMARVTLVHGM